MRVTFRKKYTRLPLADGDEMRISLKGDALLCAVEAGLIPETADGGGYNIGPFLRFWDAFSLLLPKEVKEQPEDIQKVIQMIEEYRNQRTDK